MLYYVTPQQVYEAWAGEDAFEERGDARGVWMEVAREAGRVGRATPTVT